MPLTEVFYALNVIFESAVIFMDVLIIWIAFKTQEIKRNHILHIILTAMVLDIAVYFNIILHDVPSFILDRDVSTSVTHYLSVLVLSLQYFAQLLFLPALSIIHFLAIFSPAQFRTYSVQHFNYVNVAVLLLALVISVPLFTEYCGHVYLTDGHYWYFDFTKPYTYLYRYLNWTLQAICVIILIVADTLIVYKVFRLRASMNTNRNFVSVSSRRESQQILRTNNSARETRLAKNFLLLSVCFLIMTICYNVVQGKSIWEDLLMKCSLLLNTTKWGIYALGIPSISSYIFSTIFICKSQ